MSRSSRNVADNNNNNYLKLASKAKRTSFRNPHRASCAPTLRKALLYKRVQLGEFENGKLKGRRGYWDYTGLTKEPTQIRDLEYSI